MGEAAHCTYLVPCGLAWCVDAHQQRMQRSGPMCKRQAKFASLQGTVPHQQIFKLPPFVVPTWDLCHVEQLMPWTRNELMTVGDWHCHWSDGAAKSAVPGSPVSQSVILGPKQSHNNDNNMFVISLLTLSS